jgi:TonB family protein
MKSLALLLVLVATAQAKPEKSSESPPVGGIGVIGGSSSGEGTLGIGRPDKKRQPATLDLPPGFLDKAVIKRVINAHKKEVQDCYADATGVVMVQFTIGATGGVVASLVQKSSGANASVEKCLTEAVQRWQFPKPGGGGIVIISYPFKSGTTVEVNAPTIRGALDRAALQRVVDSHANEVERCYGDASGNVSVQFTVGASGQVVAAVVEQSALADSTVGSCLSDAIRRWEFPPVPGGGIAIVSYPFERAPSQK